MHAILLDGRVSGRRPKHPCSLQQNKCRGSDSDLLCYDRGINVMEYREISRRGFVAGALGLVGGACSFSSDEDGFEPIFNGNDLSGWDGDPLLWLVENGELVGRSPGIGYNDFLATDQTYGDFILRFDVRLVDDVGNSGVQFRSERMKGSMEMIGYQADIGPSWWGDLYDESRRKITLVECDHDLAERIIKKDDWNSYEVHAEGEKIKLSINGTTTADYVEEDADIARSGRIAVQVHSGPALEVRFRNLRLRAL